MRSAGIREARQNLSALLEEVRKGREVVITDRGRPLLGSCRHSGSRRCRSRITDASERGSTSRGNPCRRRSRRTVRIASSPVYLDASALAKIYVPEPDSRLLESLLAGRRDLFVSDLAVTEVASAMACRVRERQLRRREMAEAYRALAGEVAEGRFLRAELTPSSHREAERLLMTLGERLPLRAADGLHLALAALAGARTLVTFDRRMTMAATMMGTFDLIDS